MGFVARLATSLLGGVALGVLVAGAASAQSANPNTKFVTLLERLVIGSGAAKVAIDTPQAVTVVDQKDIDDKQASTTGEIFSGVPGVMIVGSDRVFGEAFNMRGIGQTDNSADGSRIVVTVDGAPKFNEQYRMGSFFSDPELYKKVEVLRGPASSTLYGAGALGGVVNFVTKDASDFIEDGNTGAAKLKTSYSSNGNGALVSGLVAHRINETFEVLATGNYRRSDDFTLGSGTVLDGSAFATLSGLIKGTAHFGDNNEQVLRASYQRWNSSSDDIPYAQTSTQPVFGSIDRNVVDDTFVLNYENEDSDNPWVDVKLSLTYSNTTNSQSGYTNTGGTSQPPLASIGNAAILNDTDYGYRTWQLKGENTIEATGEDWTNDFTFGAQLSTQERTAARPSGAAALQQHPEGTENKLGVFAQNEYTWDQRVTLIPGIRVDFHDMTPSATIPGATKKSGVALSPKIAALYKFNENFNVFSSLAHTERFPTLDELFSVNTNATTANRTTSLGLRPESSDNFEFGVGTSAYDVAGLSNSVSAKATVFYNSINDMIASGTVTGGPAFVNVNKARLYGFELEGSYESDTLYARVAYSMTNGENAITGAALTTVAQDKVVLTVGARDLEHEVDYGTRITAAAVGDYSNPIMSQGQVVADGTAEAWATVDLYANWRPTTGPLAGTEVLFGIDNVFNANYRENLSNDRSKGRTFKLTLAKKFDY
jgi:hemoglobin/transferrin/lactoferrin receptor protein